MRERYVYCTVLLANAFLLIGFLLNGCGLSQGGTLVFPPDEDAEAGMPDSDNGEGGNMDSGDSDGGNDAATDSGTDSGIDTGTDSGTDSGPVISDAGAPNVTFDMIAMPCYKAVVIEDVSKKVVWGSGNSAICPTKLADIYVPASGYTLIVWVKDPTNNLLSFNSSATFTVTKARCSTYSTAPTWAQLESDYAMSFSSISNAATPPSYLFTKSRGSDAEYWIHQ